MLLTTQETKKQNQRRGKIIRSSGISTSATVAIGPTPNRQQQRKKVKLKQKLKRN